MTSALSNSFNAEIKERSIIKDLTLAMTLRMPFFTLLLCLICFHTHSSTDALDVDYYTGTLTVNSVTGGACTGLRTPFKVENINVWRLRNQKQVQLFFSGPVTINPLYLYGESLEKLALHAPETGAIAIGHNASLKAKGNTLTGEFKEKVLTSEQPFCNFKSALLDVSFQNRIQSAIIPIPSEKLRHLTQAKLEILQRVQNLESLSLGENHLHTLYRQSVLANSLDENGHFSQALTLKEKTYEQQRKILGEVHPDTLTSLNNLAISMGDQGYFEKAIKYFSFIEDVFSRFWGHNHENTLGIKNNLAQIQLELGRYKTAETSFNEIIKAYKAKGNANEILLSIVESNLASLYLRTGRVEQAIALLTVNSQKLESTHGPIHPQVLTLKTSLAQAHSEAGNMATAQRMLDEILSVTKSSGLVAEIYIAQSNLAANNIKLGLHKEASETLIRLTKSMTELFGEADLRTLTVVNNNAVALWKSGQLEQATTLFEKVLQGRVAKLGNEHPSVLSVRNNLANVTAESGDYVKAIDIYNELLSYQKAPGEDSYQRLTVILNLVDAYLWNNELVKARVLLQSIESEINASPDKLLVAHYTRLLGASFLVQKDWQQALPHLQNAEHLIEKWRQANSLLNDSEQKRFFASHYIERDLLFSAYLSSDKVFDAVELAEKHKASFLLEKLGKKLASEFGGLTEQQRANIYSKTQSINALQNAIAALRQHNNEKNDLSLELIDAQKAYHAEVAALDAMHRKIAATNAKFNALLYPNAMSADVMPNQLKNYLPNSTYLSFYQNSTGLYLFLLEGQNKRVSMMKLADPDTLEGIKDSVLAMQRLSEFGGNIHLYQQMTGEQLWRKPSGGYVLSNQMPNGAHRIKSRVQSIDDLETYLYEKLLKAVWLKIKDKQHLLISPSNSLSLLAFEMLKLENGKRLIEHVNVSYTPSLSVWTLTQQRQANYSSQKRYPLYAMGNPNYEAFNTEVCDEQPRALQKEAVDRNRNNQQIIDRYSNVSANREQNQRKGLSWCDLPGTSTEITAISNALKSRKNRVLVRSKASEERIRRDNESNKLGKYKYLHFATHGFLDDGAPLNSAIVLAPGDDDDGYLTAGELVNFSLRSDLVVLSACNTAANRRLPGEGVAGLPFALYLAGNQSTLMSLWAVDDTATSKYMQRFYHHLTEGLTPLEANSQVKREFINSEDFNDARYWAPFVMYGI